MYHIDGDLKDFVESGLSAVAATTDAHGRAAILPVWGARVHDDGCTMDVFLDTERAAAALANLQDNGKIAVVFGDPVTYRSVQLKGVATATAPSLPADEVWVRRQQEAFIANTSLVGDPPNSIRHLFMDDWVSVTFTVHQAFDQTPGPDAGRPL